MGRTRTHGRKYWCAGDGGAGMGSVMLILPQVGDGGVWTRRARRIDDLSVAWTLALEAVPLRLSALDSCSSRARHPQRTPTAGNGDKGVVGLPTHRPFERGRWQSEVAWLEDR